MKRAILLGIGMAILLTTQQGWGGNAVIQPGSKVKIDYSLTVEGKVIDTSEGKTPLEYTQGEGQIIPGLETQLAGLKAGEEKKVTIGPEDGYGTPDPQAVIEIPKAQIGGDQPPAVGHILQMKNPEGQVFNGMVKEIKGDNLVIDFNHPLAGKELTFDVKIVEVQ